MKQNEKLILPIDSHIPEILDSIRDYSTIIVKASPGSGKTTRLPWAVARGLNRKVVVLEPRRLAARLAAQRISEEETLTLGKEVGFHFRFEKNITEETQLIFYTEGTFLKRFLHDKTLNDVDVVILDEFHERHIDTDLALALLRDLQSKRPLKIILMSATIDLELLKTFPDSKTIEIHGVTYPVELSYLPNQPSILNEPLSVKVKNAVHMTEGDTLVFLPGMREMLETQRLLTGNYKVFILHADLSKEEQALALRPSSQRKIILATNIAESSVTIPGIRTVIDSGIQREAQYSPWNGLKFIKDVPVTKASAIQRAGRAGRTGPGSCLRLYSQQDFNEREEHTIPEIDRADLTDVRLLVAGTGLTPLWFHQPDPVKWKKATSLLLTLNAVDEKGSITETGNKMLEYPLDSRLSRVLLEGEKLSLSAKKSLLSYICDNIEQDKTGSLRRRLNSFLKDTGGNKTNWEDCLLAGFPDQVARFRQKQKDFIHYSGVILKAHSSLHDLQEGYYIIFDITRRQEAVDVLEVNEEALWEIEPFPFTEEDEVVLRPKIFIRRKTKFGSIVVEESILRLTWDSLSEDLKNKISAESTSVLNEEVNNWKQTQKAQRITFYSKVKKLNLEEVISDLSVKDYFSGNTDLSWENFQSYIGIFIEEKLGIGNIERELPLKIDLGGRRELLVHYPEGLDPYLEAPIQDFYGLKETPTLMNGTFPLTLKLLGPHKRPIQVTRDLKSFWNKTYLEMKKEYMRDYPRHYWPDNPSEAKPYLLKSHLPKA